VDLAERRLDPNLGNAFDDGFDALEVWIGTNGRDGIFGQLLGQNAGTNTPFITIEATGSLGGAVQTAALGIADQTTMAIDGGSDVTASAGRPPGWRMPPVPRSKLTRRF
jgi:hypothetical protein